VVWTNLFHFLRYSSYFQVLQREDQLLASSDLIDFEWFKEAKTEGTISITIQLTRHFNLINQTNEHIKKRRQKSQSILYFQ